MIHFQLSFKIKEFDESDYARKVADKLGTNHNELFVSEKDILNTIDKIDQTFGEPFGDSSQIPMYLLSHFTKKRLPYLYLVMVQMNYFVGTIYINI